METGMEAIYSPVSIIVAGTYADTYTQEEGLQITAETGNMLKYATLFGEYTDTAFLQIIEPCTIAYMDISIASFRIVFPK